MKTKELPGSGLLVTELEQTPILSDILANAMKFGFVLYRDCNLTSEWFTSLISKSDNAVVYRNDKSSVGYGFKDILHLKSDDDVDKIVTGPNPLPLHTDGVLLGTQVDFILLFGETVQDCNGGQTVVTSQRDALNGMSDEMRQVLENDVFEYTIEERGYFTICPEGWYHIPSYRNFGRIKSLNIALPFPDGSRRSWDVRVKGWNEEASRRYFAELERHLLHEEYSYSHKWATGDLLVVDNQQTLHGRNAFQEGDFRHLLRGQLTLEQGKSYE